MNPGGTKMLLYNMGQSSISSLRKDHQISGSKSSFKPKCHPRAEAWSSGYGRRLVFKRSWVQIPVPHTGWTFFTYI